jgi:hypothetical protein
MSVDTINCGYVMAPKAAEVKPPVERDCTFNPLAIEPEVETVEPTLPEEPTSRRRK